MNRHAELERAIARGIAKGALYVAALSLIVFFIYYALRLLFGFAIIAAIEAYLREPEIIPISMFVIFGGYGAVIIEHITRKMNSSKQAAIIIYYVAFIGLFFMAYLILQVPTIQNNLTFWDKLLFIFSIPAILVAIGWFLSRE